MKWDEYKQGIDIEWSPIYVETDIECPSCGASLYEDITVEYLTNPPQNDFYCFKCGWRGRK